MRIYYILNCRLSFSSDLFEEPVTAKQNLRPDVPGTCLLVFTDRESHTDIRRAGSCPGNFHSSQDHGRSCYDLRVH